MKKKIAIFLVLAVIASSMVILLTGAAGSGNNKATNARVVALEKQDIEKYVSATGTVYSTESTDVYSNLNYPVLTVNVRVGDKVNEGDILCELDMSSLEKDIEQKQAAVWAQQSSANQNLTSAKSDLETYRRNLENGNDSNLANAQSSVTTAEMDVGTAEIDVQTAELEIESASNNLYAARRDLREARDEGADDSELNKLKDNVRSCETALDKAQTNLEKAKASLEKVKANLNKAQASYESAKVSSSDSLVTYENKVKSAQASTNFSDQYIAIEKMQGDLENSALLSPVSGTVTAVNIVPGSSGSGLLFVIQKTDELKVIANIKEYDIAAVKLGDKVNIKADATGDAVFTGTLNRIAPTSTLTANGSVQNSTTAEYECEVTVSPGKTELKIGMNTRISIITQSTKNVYAVPYEAVIVNGDGNKIVYIASPQEDGSYLTEAVIVNTGMETDLRVEVSSETLTDGVLIIKSAEGIQAGMPVIPQY